MLKHSSISKQYGKNKDEIILLRKCITMLKQKMKHINKVYGNDSIENCQ